MKQEGHMDTNHFDTDQQHLLIEKATEARKKAYVPYSNFAVGAAFLTDSDEVYTGCNIENASYGLTNCAERTAIFKAISEAKQKGTPSFKALAVIADSKRPVPPCGACRQVLVEFCPPQMPVYLTNMEGDLKRTTVGDLLPGNFEADDMDL